jgi:glycosyltransferase involved in cell wall biosynthesis
LQTASPRDWTWKQWQLRNQSFNRHNNFHFVCDSNWIAECARKSSLLKDFPISVIHYGIDTDIFCPGNQEVSRDLLGIPRNEPVVAFSAVSTVDKRKGFALLFEALKALSKKPFLLLWGAQHPGALDDLDYYHIGSVENERLCALAYRAADVFVVPSLEEAFGQTALEALACGIPVVAFDIGGLRDTVVSGHNGLLVERGNSQALAAGIREVLDNKTLRTSWKSQAAEWSNQNYSLKKNASSYLELYRSLLHPSE